ncbi:MAG TPA: hypothetical protein ACFCUY_02155 [Xenococcaceae cyanobacterium]
MAKVPATSVIDVGGWKGEFIHSVDFIEDKTCLDRKEGNQEFSDVKYINANFLQYQPERSYDLAICLQVLEHLKDDTVGEFSEKLFTLAPRVIISVPYKWKKGACKYHFQDPVDLPKLKSWTQREPDATYIVKEKPWARIGSTQIRVICEYDSAPSQKKRKLFW